jgi:DNA-binding winged helix-turn-helix (wHTH) protein/Tol biopolymer transport system component
MLSTNINKIYEFEDFRLVPDEGLLLRNGAPISLNPKAFAVLVMLVEHNGHLVSKAEILDAIWEGAFIEEGAISKAVWFIRSALGDTSKGRFLQTIPKRGYRFVAPVSILNNPSSGLPARSEFISTGYRLPLPPYPATDSNSATMASNSNGGQGEPAENIVEGFAVIKPDQIPVIKNHRYLIGLSLIAFLASAAVAGYFYLNRKESLVSFEAGPMTRLTSSGRVKNAAISPDGKFFIYAQGENDQQQSVWMQHIEGGGNVQIIPPANIKYQSLTITPDGNSLYYHDAKGTLFRMLVLGGTPKKIADGLDTGGAPGGIGNIAISPDGSQIAYVRVLADSNTIIKTDADGLNEQTLASIERPDRIRQTLAWSPDGKFIACWVMGEATQGILAVNVADGTYSRILKEDWPWITDLTWLADSNSLLVYGYPGRIKDDKPDRGIWQVSYPGGEFRRITGDNNAYYHLDFASEVHSLLTVRTETVAQIWTIPVPEGRPPKQLTAGFEKLDGTFSLNWVEGEKIFYDSLVSGKYGIWTLEADAGDQRQLVNNINFATVSPDGRYLAYSDGAIGLTRLDLSDGSEKRLTNYLDIWPTFSPDGKTIVFNRLAEPRGLWKVPTEGGESTKIVDGPIVFPAMSPDGKAIAAISGKKVVLVQSSSGEIIKTFDITPETNSGSGLRPLRWALDGHSIYFVTQINGVSNIWKQPIDGSLATQITTFESGRIFNFVFSPDGKQFALSRGSIDSDVVLIKSSNLSE